MKSKIIINFLSENQKLIPLIEEIMVSDDMKYFYDNIFVFKGLKNTFKEVIFEKKEYIHLFFELCRNWTILKEGGDLLEHLEDDRYIMDNNHLNILLNLLLILQFFLCIQRTHL